MNKSDVLFTTTYLITPDDYLNISTSKLKIDRKNLDTIKQKIASFIMIVFLSLWFFRPEQKSSVILCFFISFLGFFFLFYFDMYIIKKLALSIYNKEKDNILSQSFSLYEDSLSINTDRHKLKIPFDMIYKFYEDKDIFVVCTSAVDMKFIPKRVLDKTQIELLKQSISNNLNKDNFIKI